MPDTPDSEPHAPDRILPPAQRLNFDVLSIIFVMAHSEWTTAALKLSSVCRLWRYIALSIPQIWSMIDLRHSMDPSNLHIFLERSKPFSLHIVLPNQASDDQLMVLSSSTDRIICMKIWDCCRFVRSQFPVLERLEITISSGRGYRDTDDDRRCFSEASWFPQLRQLCLDGMFKISVPQNGFARLEKLEIMCGNPQHWPEIVQSVSKTLLSLTLHLYYHSDHPTYHFSFPRLRHLEVTRKYVPIHLKLVLDAPCLESVDEGMSVNERNDDDRALIRLRNPKSVKQLRSGCFPLDLIHFPALQQLWISDNTEYTQTLLQSMRTQISFCRQLETILYCDHSRHPTTMNGPYVYRRPAPAFPAIVDSVRRTGRLLTVREFLPNELDLPGSIQRSDCFGSPCLRE